MGRKVEMKKIENVTRRQVTFSKRRSSLLKKAREISMYCDVDVAVVTFSPSGRVSKFCNRKRIEDIFQRYLSLPSEKRYPQIKNIENKQEKLRLLRHIIGDENKLYYLDNKIKRTEIQIQMSNIELEILEASLRNFEVNADQDPSLTQLLWCEMNLKHVLQLVTDKKILLQANSSESPYGQFGVQMERQRQDGTHVIQMERPRQDRTQASYNFAGNDQVNWTVEYPTTNELLMQLDPWISPYSSRVRERILQGAHDRAQGLTTSNGVIGTFNNYTYNLPITGLQSINQSGISSSTQGPQISPTQNTYAPMQHQAVIMDPIIPILPNQQPQGIWDNTSRGILLGHTGPVGVQHYPNQTLGHDIGSRVRERILQGAHDRAQGVTTRNGVIGTSNNYPYNLPITGLQSINQSGISSSQHQAVIMDPIIPILPNQQPQGMLGQSGPVGVQHYPNQTLGHDIGTNYLNRQDGVAPPVSHFHENPQISTWFSQDSNDFIPLNSESILSPLDFDPFFSNTVTDTSYNNNHTNNSINNNINSNNNCGSDEDDEHLAVHGQTDPPRVESPKGLLLNNDLSIEDMMGNDAVLSSAGNQDDGCLEWDGFLLAENLNMQDFDFLFD